MRYKAAELLSQKIFDEKENIYEKAQLYNFIALTTYTIDHFDKIGPGLVKPGFFYMLFLRIERPFDSTNYIDWETSEIVLKFRARFVTNLHNAFRIIPFFRFQVVARILLLLSKLSINFGVTRISKKLTTKIHSYLKLEDKYEQLSNAYF